MNSFVYTRNEVVSKLHNLNDSVKKQLQEIVDTASVIFKMPMALITLLDQNNQYIEVNVGLDKSIDVESPLKDSFCKFTIEQDKILEIHDSLADERVETNPNVVGFPHIRYYAGAPLKVTTGQALGSLCILDRKPNSLNREEKLMLEVLSKQVTFIFEFELALELLNEEMEKAQISELKLQSIFDVSTSPYILLDKNMRVLTFNDKAADYIKSIKNTSIKEGMSLTCFLSDILLTNFIQHFEIAASGRKISFEQQVNYKDNKSIFWHIILNPVYDKERRLFGISISYDDISELKNSKKQIIKHSLILQRISEIQSHKYRKPVANILGLISILDHKDCEKNIEIINHLKKQTVELDDMIRNVVNLTQQ